MWVVSALATPQLCTGDRAGTSLCTCLYTQNIRVARLKMDLPFHARSEERAHGRKP